MTKPPHTDTVQLTSEQLEKGAREDQYRRNLAEWREGKTTDARWEQMLMDDKDFRRWLWRQGM